jgi:transmembrane sensor
MQNEEYKKKWLDHDLTPEDKIVHQSQERESLEELDEALKAFRPRSLNLSESLARLDEKRNRRATIVSARWLRPVYGVAAVGIIIIMALFYFSSDGTVNIQTQTAQKDKVTLPDASVVTLSAVSHLSFDEKTWSNQRVVRLEGEAFFDVQKGSTFDVITSSGTVRVVGTEFTVKDRKDFFEVVCYEGVVRVEAAQQSVELTPGKMFRVVMGIHAPLIASKVTTPPLLANESFFQSVPVEEVLQEFERQYGVKVTTNDVDVKQLFTGTFVHTDRELALKAISQPLGVTYSIENDHVVLRK